MPKPICLNMIYPDIGCTVLRTLEDGSTTLDWVAQVRIGDEQGVFVWGAAGRNFERFRPGIDTWRNYVFPEEHLSCQDKLCQCPMF